MSVVVTHDPMAASAASRPDARVLSPAVRWGAALLFGLLISDARSLTLPATGLVILGGAGIWLAGKYSPPTSDPEAAPVTPFGIGVWAGLFAVLCLWELSAFVIGNNDDHPTLSMLADPVLSFGPTRAVCGVAWLACGWYLLARRGDDD